MLGGALISYDQEGIAGIGSLQACQVSFGDDMDLFNQTCDLSRNCFNRWYQESSVQDKAQAATEVLADLIITPFVVGKAMKVCGRVLVQAREAVNLARTIELAEELGLGCVEAEELLLATEAGTQKLPVAAIEIERVLTEFIETEVAVAQCGINFSEISQLSVFIEEFHKLKGIVPALDRILIKQINKALKRISLELPKTCINDLTKMYAQRKVGETMVYAALDHFCNAKMGLKFEEEFGGYVLNISGGHLYGACEAIERAGLVKIKEIKSLSSGALHYYMEDIFTGRIIDKTIVPQSWDARKLCDAAWKLYEGAGEVKEAVHGFKKIGFVDGIKLQMYYSINKEVIPFIHKIVTCYPI